jgi:hypothetical protein
VSVAGQFRRGTSGFRVAGGETVGCGSVSVLGGAGRGCQRVGGTVPCTGVHGTGLAHALVHGNASPTLRALGGAVASERRGRGGVHGRARGLLLRGIDSSGRGKPGSEVTGHEMDGGMPTLLECPRWPWRRPGRRGVARARSLQGGAGLGCQQGGDQLLGVGGGGLVED